MFDYRSELERRIEQFASYLRPMNHRAHEIAATNCFMIFEESHPDDRDKGVLVESKQLTLQSVQSAFNQIGFVSDSDGLFSDFTSLPDEGWRDGNSSNRFIQFAFGRQWFCIDMPLQTLFRPEAEEILRYRKGFFDLADRKEFTMYQEDVAGFDPFRKIYIYGDEQSAAEDMAFIFFHVWKFPIDSRFYVSSAAFNGMHSWEKAVPIQ